VDPESQGSEPFFQIRIRFIGSDPGTEPKRSKCKFYVVKIDFYALKIKFCMNILTLKFVKKRTLPQKEQFYNGKK